MNRLTERLTSVSMRTNVLAFVAAFVIGGILVALAAEEARLTAPFTAYAALLSGAVGSVNALSETLSASAPLILTGLAVAVPIRAGLFNIGGEGQVIAGGAAAGYVGFALLDVPMILHVPLALLAALLVGAAFGAVPGFLKARTGAHEVITTIMLNNFAAAVLAALLVTELFQKQGALSAISKDVQDSARLCDGGDLPGDDS